MDPKETSKKPLNQVPFHQVKGINDKRRENPGYKGFTGTRVGAEHKLQWAKSHTLWDRNGQRGDYVRKPVPGINREFRVVRDNRMNQKASIDVMPGSLQNSTEDNHQVTSNSPEKSSVENLIDQKHSASRNSDDGQCNSGPGHGIDEKSSGSHGSSLLLPGEKQMAVSKSTEEVLREVKNNSQAHSETFASAGSVIGVYSSSSDPVHVPSSRSFGTVGAIRREVGVVGVWRQSSEHSATCTSSSSNPVSLSLSEKDASSSRHSATTSKSSYPNPSPVSEPIIPSMSVNRSFVASQYHVLHQQVAGRQKASRPNLEWKPKASQKPNANNPCATTHSNQVQAAVLSEKLLQVNLSKDEHVIIPQHLLVPESERAGLMFGSFGTGFNSTKGFASAFQAVKSAEGSSIEPSLSSFASVQVGSNKDSADDQSGLVDSQRRTSRSDSSMSAAEPEHTLLVDNESPSPRDIESYPDIGLIQSHNPSYSSPVPQQQQDSPSLPNFLAYDPKMRLDVPFSKAIVEDNARGLGLSSGHEAFSSHAANCSPLSSVPMAQQQQHVTPFYPQVHISHYPNFVPYQQMFPPVYVPQMAMPHYSNNPAYPHPTNGSNYLLMPGRSSPLTSGSMKYTASQYKPVHAGSPTAGYGNYNNPGGYTVGTIGSTTGLEDVARIKYKDNNVYVPNPQTEASDIWIQTPRELASLQSTQYYNLSGQAAARQTTPHAAYMPAAHTAHPSFNAAAFQSSPLQYPGLYQPSQPGSLTGHTNHIVHQQLPSALTGNAGIGVVTAATSQVAAYQQPQVGNLGWATNF